MPQLTQYEKLALQKLAESIHCGKWSNDGMVELIKLTGEYLNLMTATEYARHNKLSYPGARKNTQTRKNIEHFSVKYIIDND